MPAFSAKTKDDWKIEQCRGLLGVVLLRKKEGFQGLCSGSVVNLIQSKHFPSCKERKEVKCLLTSGDVFRDGDSNKIVNYVIEYWDLDLKSGLRLKLSDVAQSTGVFQPTPGLALIPVLPTKGSSLLSYFNLKSSVFDGRRTFHTVYYCNEDGESKTRNQIRCFIAGSPDLRTDSFKVESFTLISLKNEQGQLRYELQDEHDQSIFKTYGEIRAKNLYPRGAPILKCKSVGKEQQVACVGVLNFSNDDKKKISPVFFTQETLTGQVQLYLPTLRVDQASVGAIGHVQGGTAVPKKDESCKLGQVQLYLPTLHVDQASVGAIGHAQGGTAVPKKDESCKLGQGDAHETHLARNALAHGYRIREVYIPPDGNCLYHAVKDQLEVLGDRGRTHKDLRNLAVQELRSNLDDNHLSMDLAKVVENNDATKYINKMSVDGEWGGHPELVALSHALQRTIRVVSSTSETGKAIQDVGSFDGSPILLGHQHNHYWSLEKVKNDVEEVHTLTAGPKKSPAASLSRNARSVVTGRSKHPPSQNMVIPGEESGRPSQHYDVTEPTSDYSRLQKEEYLQNINVLLTSVGKINAELDRVQRQFEEERENGKRQKEQISELHTTFKNIQAENEGLHSENSALRFEVSALLGKVNALQSRVNSQNTCAVCGNDSASSKESTAAKLSPPTKFGRSASSGSSEEEYVDALSELGGSTLE